MKVFWTDRATARLQQIHAFIAQEQPQNAIQGRASTVGSRTITHLLDEEFRVGGLPAFERLKRSFVAECLLWQMVVVEPDVSDQRLLQILA